MKLFTSEQYNKLIDNGSGDNRDKDHIPVVKLFLAGTRCTWLITELDPDEPDIAFGLCDHGMGFPELGYVSIEEITSVKHPILGVGVERDPDFNAVYPISVYAEAARNNRRIVEHEAALMPIHQTKQAKAPKPQ